MGQVCESCSLDTPICPGHLSWYLQGPAQGNAGAITAVGRIRTVLLIIEEESISLGYALQGLRYPQVRAVSLLTRSHHLPDSSLAFGVEANPLVLFFSQKPPGPILPPYSGLPQDFFLIAASKKPVPKPKCCSLDLFPLRCSECCMHLLNPRLHLAMGVSGGLVSVHLPTDHSWVD